MASTEESTAIQRHLLAVPSAIGDDRPGGIRRTASILTLTEPVVLVVEEPDGGHADSTVTPKSFALSGILYGLLGCLLSVSSSFSMKELQIDFLDVLIIRFIMQICLFAAFVIYHHYPMWKGSTKEKWLQFVLWIINGLVFLTYYIGFRYLPLPDLTTLGFTRLIWTVAFGVLIYKERPTAVILTAVCLTFVGVVFVAQPTFIFPDTRTINIAQNRTSEISNITDTMYSSSSRVIGISLALLTGLLSAFNLLIFKQLITLKLKPSVLMLQHSFVFLLCMILNQCYKYLILNDLTLFTVTIFRWKYWLSALISLLQTLAVIVGNRAVKREPPSVVTVVSAADIIYAVLLQNLLTSNKSNRWVLLGSALVVSSVFLIGIQKFMQERRPKKKKIDDGKETKN